MGEFTADARIDAETRALVDRRRRPTPMLSRYWLRGRRRGARRASEALGQYVDRYARHELALALWIALAGIADLALTLLHIEDGGGEANPFMAWFLELGGAPLFAAAKLALTFGATLFLLLHVHFRITRPALWAIAATYAGVMVVHVAAAVDRGALGG